MADNSVNKWYVVRAVSGQENKVKSYIETEISRLEMSDYISQVLVPTEKVVTVKDGKIELETAFQIKLADHKIQIPSVVAKNIAEVVNVNARFVCIPHVKK